MDSRQKLIESLTDRELVDELKRRYAILDEARTLLSGVSTPAAKNPLMSQAKAAYWAAWHEYKAAHPDATLEQWRRAQKRSSRK